MLSNKRYDKKIFLKLRDIRKEKGLSINALAEKAGIDYQKVGRMERGETQISIDILHKLAGVLHVSISDLLEEVDINKIEKSYSQNDETTKSIYLIPSIYEKLDELCFKHQIDMDNTTKVHLATVLFTAVLDIRTNVRDDVEMVKALFQAFDAIFERLVLSQVVEDCAVK